jgi:hypothetical protein
MERPAASAERYLITRATTPPKHCRSRHSRVCPTFRAREPELATFSCSPRLRPDRLLPQPGFPHTLCGAHMAKAPLRDICRSDLVASSSTQLSTTCVRIVGTAEAESLGAGARDLKVLGRRPAAEARRAVTLAMSSLLRKRSRNMSCHCRRVGLCLRLSRLRISLRCRGPARAAPQQLRASRIARRRAEKEGAKRAASGASVLARFASDDEVGGLRARCASSSNRWGTV